MIEGESILFSFIVVEKQLWLLIEQSKEHCTFLERQVLGTEYNSCKVSPKDLNSTNNYRDVPWTPWVTGAPAAGLYRLSLAVIFAAVARLLMTLIVFYHSFPPRFQGHLDMDMGDFCDWGGCSRHGFSGLLLHISTSVSMDIPHCVLKAENLVSSSNLVVRSPNQRTSSCQCIDSSCT